MKTKSIIVAAAGLLLAGVCFGAGGSGGTSQKAMPATARIILLHHSTGECVWNGGVAKWFRAYNAANKTKYTIAEQNFPKDSPYGWENYPYDYWNIWIKHAGKKPFKGEGTLEILTAKYDVIVFKHCFPVSNIEADTGRGDVSSKEKRIENYKVQYAALKKKMRQFPKTRFIVWTGAAQVKNDTDEAMAKRAKAFFDWVRKTWDQKGDNIYLWDFYQLETEGGLYMKAAYASGDAHPNEKFSRKVAPYLCRRIVDVIRGRGDTGSITGKAGEVKPVAPVRPPKPAPPTAYIMRKGAPATKPAAKAPTATTPAKIVTSGPGRWLFDDAEKKALAAKRWGKVAEYVKAGDGNVVKINFAAARQEDWGEYGPHRVVSTLRAEKDHDIRAYRFVAMRVKADQKIHLTISLVTLPARPARADQSYFGFSAYVDTKAGAWKNVVLDLTKLELNAEGETAYAKAGKPSRPMHMSVLRLAAHKKHEKATFFVDDITFFRELPKALKAHLQQP